MLLGLVHLLHGPAAWTSISSALFPETHPSERIALSIVCGLTTSSWLSLLGSTVTGRFDTNIVLLSMTLHFLAHYYLTRESQQSFDTFLSLGRQLVDELTHREGVKTRRGFLRLALFGAMYVMIGAIMWTHLLAPDPSGRVLTGGNCYSDLPFHTGLISAFAHGCNSGKGSAFSVFRMQEVIMSGNRLIYPVIPDYISATLVILGYPLRDALLWPSLLVLAAFLLGLYAFAGRVSVSSWTPLMTLFLALCAGGSFDFTEPEFWLYLVKDILLPQRSALFAYTLAMTSACSLWAAFDLPSRHTHPESWRKRWQLLQFAGLQTSLLPYLQGHAFLSLAFISVLAIALDVVSSEMQRRSSFSVASFVAGLSILVADLLAWGMFPFLFGLPQMYSYMATASRWGFATYLPMWTKHPSGALSWLWDALGVQPFLVLIALYGPVSITKPRIAMRLIPFAVLFVVACFFKFQPWNVDNMKIFYITYFPFLAVIADLICALPMSYTRWQGPLPSLKKQYVYIVVCSICSLVLTLHLSIPGLQCLIQKELMHQSVLLNPADVQIADWALKHTGPDSVFLVHHRHNHPIPMLAGRAVYYGYKGWLQTRGYRWGMREQFARKILKGNNTAPEICRNNGIDYIALPKHQPKVENVKVDHEFLRKTMEKVYDNELFVVYEVKRKGRAPKRHMFGDLLHFDITSRAPDPNRH